MLLWKFAKFLMSFLKAQVSFCPNLATLSIVMKYKSSVLFQLKNYIIWSKTAQESVIFLDLSARFKIIKFLISLLKRQVNSLQIFHHSSVSLLLCRFLVYSFCTLDKKIPWKYQFWHCFFSVLKKISQTPYIIF